MKSIIFKKPGVYAYEDRPVPQIKNPDDVQIKVLGVGICGTDLHVLMDPPKHPAKPDIIFGHEYCGEVVAVGSAVKSLKPGDKVIVDPHPPCGHCENCRSDRPGQCTTLYSQQDTPWPEHGVTRGLFADGALCSYTCVPAQSVYKIDNKTPYQLAALAEPLSCVGYAIEKLKIQAGDTVCVLGAGPMGLLFAAMAKALADKGPQGVILTGIHNGPYIGNFIYDQGKMSWVRAKKVGGDRSGTGDVFTAIVSASVVRGESLEQAVQKASDFICRVMAYTEELDLPHNAGLAFEEYLTTLR